MAENFWDADKPASKDAFWSDDKSAAQQDLPAGVAPSTAGGGRGVLADPRRIDAPAPAPVAQGNPMGSGFEEMTSQPAAPASVLEGVDLPEPTVSDAQQAENVSLSNRRYAERTPQVTDAPRTVARQDSRQVQDSRVEGLGLRVGDQSTPVRIVGQAVGQGAEALGGLTRAVGDAVGSRTVADFGANAANNAQAFQDAIGKPRTGTDFNPRGPMPYLAEQFENAGSSLATSYATARAFGAKAVIPLLSVQDGAQYYNQARQAGRTPGEALALAIPHGTFEALGEKFEGLDKAMGAMQVLLTRGAPRQALESAGKILIENGIKEVPGEVFTYLGQSGLDNLPGIGINRDMTMGQWLDGLRDTVVQAGMMGTFSGGAGAISHIRAEAAKPREKTPEELAREKGFLVREEQAKRLAAAGDKEVAAGLQRQVNTERSDQELSALRDQPWAKGDVFEERYKQLRADGKAPAEAAARAAMANAYAQIGKHLSLNDNAFRKAADAAATLPMEKVPQFFEQVTANLVKKGMSQPVPEGTIGGAVSGARDAAVEGAMTQVYGEQSHSDTVKGILDMEAQQEGAAAAPAAEPAAAPRETEGQQPGRSPLHPDDLTPNEAGAHAGASSPLNDKTATREQILAGNAPLGHMTLGEGSPGGKTNVSIENAAGSVRTDIHNEPPKWSTPMENGYHYGYIRRTEGNDGDKFDVFVKEGLPENWAGTVWVVDQASRDGKFDEHKGVIGPQTEQEARDAYLSHYEKGWTGLRAVTPMPWAEFKQWVHDGKKTEPANPAAFAQAATPAADAPAEERGGRAPAAAPAVGEPARAAGEDAGPVAPALRLGKMPNNAEAVTLAKDGTVMIGKYAAVDYDSGEPVVLKPDANESQIKHALHNAGAVPAGHKFFGGAKEAVAPAPKPKQNAAAQDSTTAAPSQGAGSQQASAATPPAASAAPSKADEKTQEAPPARGAAAAEDPQALQRAVIELRKDVAVLRRIRDCVAKGMRQ